MFKFIDYALISLLLFTLAGCATNRLPPSNKSHTEDMQVAIATALKQAYENTNQSEVSVLKVPPKNHIG